MRFAALPAVVAAVTLGLPGCSIFIIDHHQNALDFCAANVANDVFKTANIDNDGAVFTEKQATYWSDEFAQTLRYAEDSTKALRKAARDLSDAYDDVRDLAVDDNDVPQAELDEKYGTLRARRIEVRDDCAPYLAELQEQRDADAAKESS